MGHSLDGLRNREAGQANAAYNIRVYWRSLAVSSLAKLCAAGITDVIHSRDSFSLRP